MLIRLDDLLQLNSGQNHASDGDGLSLNESEKVVRPRLEEIISSNVQLVIGQVAPLKALAHRQRGADVGLVGLGVFCTPDLGFSRNA